MNFEPASLMVGLLTSTIGFSLFLYGKKQLRVPQAIAGVLLMVAPLLVGNAWLLAGTSAAALVAMHVALRAGH